MHETFWTLLRDPAHWLFELFLMLLFDGLVAGILWPFVRVHWKHHIDRDNEEAMWEQVISQNKANVIMFPGHHGQDLQPHEHELQF